LAKTLDPGNAKLSRQMGEVYSWRVATTPEPAKTKELGRQMLQTQAKSAEQRPASPFIWTDIILTKDRLGAYDAEFLNALKNAASLAPWDPSVQSRTVEIGLTSWYRLPDAARTIVIGTLERGMTTQPEPMREMITRNKRQWLVCAYAEAKRMGGLCDKLASHSTARSTQPGQHYK
jgi:hypothetical protein